MGALYYRQSTGTLDCTLFQLFFYVDCCRDVKGSINCKKAINFPGNWIAFTHLFVIAFCSKLVLVILFHTVYGYLNTLRKNNCDAATQVSCPGLAEDSVYSASRCNGLTHIHHFYFWFAWGRNGDLPVFIWFTQPLCISAQHNRMVYTWVSASHSILVLCATTMLMQIFHHFWKQNGFSDGCVSFRLTTLEPCVWMGRKSITTWWEKFEIRWCVSGNCSWNYYKRRKQRKVWEYLCLFLNSVVSVGNRSCKSQIWIKSKEKPCRLTTPIDSSSI